MESFGEQMELLSGRGQGPSLEAMNVMCSELPQPHYALSLSRVMQHALAMAGSCCDTAAGDGSAIHCRQLERLWWFLLDACCVCR